ncbi:hypothetical protein CF65_01500 [Aggregatibacter actinomycetemcomitans HK1651]|nr:hypothetical protein CF65_01500 [Aggregatibacter actinomycetemcomitans HK1651]
MQNQSLFSNRKFLFALFISLFFVFPAEIIRIN